MAILLFLINPITWSYTTPALILSSPAIADIDTSTTGSEIIFAEAYGGNYVYCMSSTGTVLWTATTGWVYTSPCIGNLGHQKDPAIVVASYSNNQVFCINNDGTIRWTYQLPASCGSSPAIANIDTIGDPEVIFGCKDGNLYCLNNNGVLVWSTYLSTPIGGESPAIANIDRLGTPEIIINTKQTLYCLNSDGSIRWSSNLPTPYTRPGFSYGVSPSIADVDLDNDPEIIVGDQCFESDGSLRWDYGLSCYSTSAIADLDYDDTVEIVTWSHTDSLIYVLKDRNGVPALIWTAPAEDPSGTQFTTPTICDIMGDSARDVLFVAGLKQQSYLRIYDGRTGAIILEDTNFASNTCSEHGAVAADVDTDGIIEIVAIYDCYGVALLEDDANFASCNRNRFSGHLYHITELNNDLSVPKKEPYHWETHNSWLAQICEKIPKVDETKIDYDFELYQNEPNPFFEKTTIKYNIKKEAFVSIKVYDIAGKLVSVLVNENKTPGTYTIVWNAKLKTGIYYIVLEIDNIKQIRKAIILNHK